MSATILDSSLVERQVNEGIHRLVDVFEQCEGFEEATIMEVTGRRKTKERKCRPAKDTVSNTAENVDTQTDIPGCSVSFVAMEETETSGDALEDNSSSDSGISEQCEAPSTKSEEVNTIKEVNRRRKRRLSTFVNNDEPPEDNTRADVAESNTNFAAVEKTEANEITLTEDSAEHISSSENPSEENGEVETKGPRRSQRKKIRTSLPEEFNVVVPRSIKLHQNSSLKDIQNYYLDKRVKRLNPSLETIFEEPHVVNNEDVMMSSRKFKRMIDFNNTTAKNNAAKVRKRKAKAKTVKNRAKAKKVSMKFLMDKLDELEKD